MLVTSALSVGHQHHCLTFKLQLDYKVTTKKMKLVISMQQSAATTKTAGFQGLVSSLSPLKANHPAKIKGYGHDCCATNML